MRIFLRIYHYRKNEILGTNVNRTGQICEIHCATRINTEMITQRAPVPVRSAADVEHVVRIKVDDVQRETTREGVFP